MVDQNGRREPLWISLEIDLESKIDPEKSFNLEMEM